MFETLQNLDGKVAVVCGGNGGIGSAIVKRLLRHGAKVVVLTRNLEDCEEGLREDGADVNYADVTYPNSLISVAEYVREKYGRLDILVNCAGKNVAIPYQFMDEHTDEVFRDILDVNVVGAFALMRAFMTLLKMYNDSVVIHISSTSARTGGASIAYAASKAALNNMIRNLAKKLALWNIRVLAVEPSQVDTNFMPIDQKTRLAAIHQTPLRRHVEADDVAAMVESLIMNARFTTGHSYVVDGGRSL